MKSSFVLLGLAALGLSISLHAEQWGTLDDGTRIIVNSDGTWHLPPVSDQNITGLYTQVPGTAVGDLGSVKYLNITAGKTPGQYVIETLKADKTPDLKGSGVLVGNRIDFSIAGKEQSLSFTLSLEGPRVRLKLNWPFGTHQAYYSK